MNDDPSTRRTGLPPIPRVARDQGVRLRDGAGRLLERLNDVARANGPRRTRQHVALFNLAEGMSGLVTHISHQARGRRPVVLIDGGSGAGKSRLAQALNQLLGYQLVSLDDCYPGWGGLAKGADSVTRDILNPAMPGYRRWDWAADAPADWVSLDPDSPIIVEGCGAITPASRALATTSIWFERDADQRHDLVLRRDGDVWERWWDVWATQEQEHQDSHHPQQLADVVVVDIASIDQMRPSADADGGVDRSTGPQ